MGATSLRWSESSLIAVALVTSTFFVSFGVLHYGFYTRKLLMDTPIYERYGDAIVHSGKVPYRDFVLEYPPGALPAFAAPSLAAPAGDFPRYARLFEVLMLLCGAVAAALVALVLTWLGARPASLVAGTLLAGLAPLALGPVVLSRFDLWPAVLTVGALAALVADRRRLAFALLGAGIAAKLYPVVLVPLALAYVWRRHGRRAATAGAAVLAVVVAAFGLPFLLASPSGVWASVSGQASRPLEMESLGASFLLAAHQAWGLPVTVGWSHGSDNLSGRLPDALALAQSLLVIAVLASIWVGFARGDPTRDRLLRYSAGAVCAFVALDKVLSPQYLIWLMALIPLVRTRRGAVAGALFVASMVITQLWFPTRYIALVYGLDVRASWLVFARDLVLLALLVTLVWPQRWARRAGVAVVTALTVAAAAAVAAAAVSSSPANVATHSGLLGETGVASSCSAAKAVPARSAGSVSYETATLPNPGSRPACVTVALTAQRHVQLFSASYRARFDGADPRARYLGDAGRCTNVAGAAGRELTYSIRAAARSAFVVEVENCGSGAVVPPYLLDVRDVAVSPVAYAAATATARRSTAVVVRWRTSSETPGVEFTVYRVGKGRLVEVTRRAIAGVGSRGGAYAVTDPHPPLTRPLRYWIRARIPSGGWSWHGPLTSTG